jgi:hypothetical protein
LFGGEGGLVVCRWGELGLGRRRRNRGGEGQQRGHILTFSDGFFVGESVGYSDRKIDTSSYIYAISNPSVIPSVKITPPKPPRQQPAFFFNSELSVRNSVGNYRQTLSVGSYRLNYKQKKFRR